MKNRNSPIFTFHHRYNTICSLPALRQCLYKVGKSIFLQVIILIGASNIVQAQVTVVGGTAMSYNQPNNIGATTIFASYSIPAGSDRVLVITHGGSVTPTTSNLTFDGNNMTALHNVNSSGRNATVLYYVVPGMAALSGNIQLTTVEFGGVSVSAVVLSGVNSATPTDDTGGNTGLGTSSNIAGISSGGGNLLIDCIDLVASMNVSLTADIGQTTYHNTSTNHVGGASYELGSASTSMGWSWSSGTTYAHAALEFVAANPAPVELTFFKAEKDDRRTNLTWQTATESNNDYFKVERSSDGRSFQQIGKIDGVGNSTVFNDYHFVDLKPFSGENYYRLAQVDFDGKTVLSKIEFVNFSSSSASLSIFPNPTKDFVNITFEGNVENPCQIEIHDANGKKIHDEIIDPTKGFISLNSLNWTPGIYLVRWKTPIGTIAKKLVKME